MALRDYLVDSIVIVSEILIILLNGTHTHTHIHTQTHAHEPVPCHYCHITARMLVAQFLEKDHAVPIKLHRCWRC